MKERIPKVVKGAAALMAADIMLLSGFVFLLLGISKFLNDFLGVEGSGEGIVGLLMLGLGLLILLRSKMSVSFRQIQTAPPPGSMPPQPSPKEAPTDSYR